MVPINLSEYVLNNLIWQVVQESSICVLVSVEMNDPAYDFPTFVKTFAAQIKDSL
jgi:hypothetical protein